MTATRKPKVQIAFRYRTVDSASGVTRKTVKRLAEYLGVDESQAIHQALHELATKVLPQYEEDEGSALSLTSPANQEARTARNEALSPVEPVRNGICVNDSMVGRAHGGRHRLVSFSGQHQPAAETTTSPHSGRLR